MADWEPSTSYSPGASVTYLGLPYVRSQFPPTPTSGTNPSVEMGVDPKGDPIRTWELRWPTPLINYGFEYPFLIGYFSLLAPARSDGIYASEPPLASYPGKFYPEHPYAGATSTQNAYGYIGTSTSLLIGESVEVDQARAATPAIPPYIPAYPSAPVMPAAKCGVGMQFFQETSTPEPIPPEPYLTSAYGWMVSYVNTYENLTYNSVTEQWYQNFGATPRIFYAFLYVNHPLFFRRQHTITFRISTTVYATGYEIPDDPPIIVPGTFTSTYSSVTQPVTPTDKNFWSLHSSQGDNWIQPSNAITTYTLPDNVSNPGPYGSTTGTTYEVVEVFVSDIESND